MPLAPDTTGRLPPDDAELEAGAGGEDGDCGGIGGDKYGEEDAEELEELLPPDAAKSGGPSKAWTCAVSSGGLYVQKVRTSTVISTVPQLTATHFGLNGLMIVCQS